MSNIWCFLWSLHLNYFLNSLAALAGSFIRSTATPIGLPAALPTLDIAEGALNQLIDTYKLLLPQLGGYLTNAGELNHERLQMLLGAVADRELETLEERAAVSNQPSISVYFISNPTSCYPSDSQHLKG